MPIKVPQKVYDGIKSVRQSGETNMLDASAVQVLCNKMGFYDAVLWIEDNRRDYAIGIFSGFEVEGGS